MEELRKCPFCGGEAELHSGLLNNWVLCLQCGVETKAKLNKQEAIAAWNRRVTQNIGKKECCVQGEEQEG